MDSATTTRTANEASALSAWIWRLPPFVDRGHDEPLSVQVSDLFQDFPYHRLETTSSTLSVSLLMHPYFLLGAVGFYLLSIPLLASMRNDEDGKKKNNKESSALFQVFVALHNLGLAIFSGVCAWNTCLITLDNLMTNGLWSTCCDTDGQFWKQHLGGWAFVFYVSKYYEFVDTWILVLKKGAGKSNTTLFLQVYHHAGIVMILWAAVSSQSAWQFVSNMLNSVIHTLMYTYFFIKTISPKTEIRAAKYLTMAQIGQFFLGIFISIAIVLIGGDQCSSPSSSFSLICLVVYGSGLIALFMSFATKKYGGSKANGSSNDTKPKDS